MKFKSRLIQSVVDNNLHEFKSVLSKDVFDFSRRQFIIPQDLLEARSKQLQRSDDDRPSYNILKALVKTIKYERLEMFHILLAIPAVRDNANLLTEELLVTAMHHGNFGLFNIILDLPHIHMSVSLNNNNVLLKASNDGFEYVRRLLLIPSVYNTCGLDFNKPLIHACANTHSKTVIALLEIEAVRNNIDVDNCAVVTAISTRLNDQAFLGVALNPRILANPQSCEILLTRSLMRRTAFVFNKLMETPAIVDFLSTSVALSSVFVNLTLENHPDAFLKLMKYRAFSNLVESGESEALSYAIKYNRDYIFEMLMKIPNVYRRIASNDNKCVRIAVESKNFTAFSKLIENMDVLYNIRIDNYQILLNSIDKDDNARIFDRLMQIPEVVANAAINRNAALRSAIVRGSLHCVNRLLQIPAVVDTVTENDNDLLMLARQSNDGRIVARLLQIPAVRLGGLAAERAPQTNSKVNTHTASIHTSASSSAKRLSSTYNVKDYNSRKLKFLNVPDLNIEILDFYAFLGLDEQLFFSDFEPKLRKNILDFVSDESKNLALTDPIMPSIYRAVIYIFMNEFVDPGSKVSLKDLFKLIIVAINNFATLEAKRDACFQLLTKLYVLHNEYAANAPSCLPGIFNGIIYSQHGVLPEVNIVLQNKNMAIPEILKHMTSRAIEVLNKSQCTDLDEFEMIIEEELKTKSMDIANYMLWELFTLFELKSQDDVLSISDSTVIEKFNKVYGCNPDDLYDFLPLDYEKLYTKYIAERAVTSTTTTTTTTTVTTVLYDAQTRKRRTRQSDSLEDDEDAEFVAEENDHKRLKLSQ